MQTLNPTQTATKANKMDFFFKHLSFLKMSI